MMDQELKAKWVAALRSGEYKQTTGCLQNDAGNCCLGVLCRVVGIPAVDEGRFSGRLTFQFPTTTLVGMPPNGFMNLDADLMAEVAQMNDDGKTFAEIADVIEERA